MMKPIDRHRGLLTAVAVGVWCVASPPAATGATPASARGEAGWGVTLQWQGAGSCAAGACHNSGGSKGSARLDVRNPTRLSEYTHWVKFDPHAKAFGILYGIRSRRIEQNLRDLTSLEDAHPERDGLCLNCHVHQNFEQSRHVEDYSLDDGVACESCHGAAEQWLGPHTQAGWKSLPDEQKSAYGMVPTKNLVERARVCVSCHVGSPVPDPNHGLVDVNHDLIAAGHPRMNFENASFLAIYPRHWNLYEEKARIPDLEARAWAIGQVVTGQQALELLGARASRAAATPASRRDQTGGWPEFSEYSCFACHRDMRGEGVVGQTGRPGTLPWGTWYFPLLSDEAFPANTPEFLADLKAVRLEMNKPYPDPAAVAAKARKAAGGLDSLLETLHVTSPDPRQLPGLMAALARPRQAPDRLDWDRGAQLYLGLAALYHAQSDQAPGQLDPRWRPALKDMVEELRFPPRQDSPGMFGPTSFQLLLQHLGQ